jgi:hypothetical protein
MKDALTAQQEGQLDVCMEEDSSVTHDIFPFVRGRHSTLLNQIALHDSGCSALHYSILLVQQLERELRKEKEPSQIPMSRTTSPIEVRTSKLNQSSARSEMTLSWITEQDGYMKAR